MDLLRKFLGKNARVAFTAVTKSLNNKIRMHEVFKKSYDDWHSTIYIYVRYRTKVKEAFVSHIPNRQTSKYHFVSSFHLGRFLPYYRRAIGPTHYKRMDEFKGIIGEQIIYYPDGSTGQRITLITETKEYGAGREYHPIVLIDVS